MQIRKRIQVILITFVLVMVCQVRANAQEETEMMNVAVQVNYDQKEAREMLTYVNEFRTGDETWYWDKDNKTKINCGPLKKLKYDYELEEVAMQRAAEIALVFSHTRPNGTACFTAYPSSNCTAGENLAAGMTTAQETVDDLKETADNYGGQGHRRAMLSDTYVAMGAGHVIYQGYHYWVQEFRNSNGFVSESVAFMGDKTVQVEIIRSKLSQTSMSKEVGFVMAQGESAPVPTVVDASTMIDGHFPSKAACKVQLPVEWKSENESVAIVENGTLKAITDGTTNLTCSMFNQKISVSVNITCLHELVTMEAKAPGCLNEGKTEGSYCKKCGKVQVMQEIIPARGHDEVVDYGTKATCFRDGKTDGSHCRRCDATIEEQKVIKALGHDWDEGTVVRQFTEYTKGSVKYTCGRCNETKYTVIPASGTPFNIGTADIVTNIQEKDGKYVFEIDKSTGNAMPQVKAVMMGNEVLDPSCYSLKISMGDAQSEPQIVIVAKTNCEGSKAMTFTVVCEHRKITQPAVAASCKNPGLTEGCICEKCGKVFVKQEKIVVEHKWNAGKIIKAPTVAENGKKEYTCTLCGATKQETLDKLKDSGAAGTTQGATTGKSDFTYTSTTPVKKGQTISVKSGESFKIVSSTGKSKTVAFAGGAKNMYTATIPDTIKVNGKAYKVTSIQKNAFKNNTSITSVTIGKNITKIGKNAFYGCKNLKKIKIKSKKIKSIGAHAFKKINKKAKYSMPSKKKKAYKKMLTKASK